MGPELPSDLPLQRVVKLRHLPQLLSGELVLVSPTVWDDPFESLPWRMQIVDKRDDPWKLTVTDGTIARAWAQCWTHLGHSDLLLRAYSQVSLSGSCDSNEREGEEGVLLTTTAGKLWGAAQSCSGFSGQLWLGRTIYLPRSDVEARVGTLARDNASRLDSPDVVISMLKFKRDWFHMEREVRLIYATSEAPFDTHMTIAGAARDLVDHISFDPRLSSALRLLREAQVRKLGYRGKFVSIDAYQGTMLEVVQE